MIVTVIGDAFLDRDIEGHVERVCPDAPVPVVEVGAERTRPGGAALAAALLTMLGPPGTTVRLLAAFGNDEAADALLGLLEDAGVEVTRMARRGPTMEKVRVRAAGQSLLRLDRGPRAAPVEPGPGAGDAIAGADAVLVADYGAGAVAAAHRWLTPVAARRPVVWDPHPDGATPVAGAWLVTPNEREALAAAGVGDGPRLRQAEQAGRLLASRWGARAVAVTLGEAGAMLIEQEGPPLFVPAQRHPGDACGAGDCLAAAATVALGAGALPSEAVTAGVAAASCFVASGGAAAASRVVASGGAAAASRVVVSGGAARLDLASTAPPPSEDAVALAARVRAQGGTVVAAGGCFDLVHAGHVALLERARALGDCLIVCVNSDTSVARLKGPGRPVQTELDRAAVLRALGAVDAVAVFGEDTPVRLLEELRPHVFVKGGDYAVGELPEARAVASWGGQVVILPYLRGRSTTALLERATRG